MKDLLAREGYAVVEARNGVEALDQVDRHAPDVIVLDLNLPDMDGYSVLSQLRSRPATRKTPVIVLTAKGDEDNEVRVFELGADDFLTKPFRAKALSKTARGGAGEEEGLRRCEDDGEMETDTPQLAMPETSAHSSIDPIVHVRRSERPRPDQAVRPRRSPAYTLSRPRPPQRKLNQNESPFDLPAAAQAGDPGARAGCAVEPLSRVRAADGWSSRSRRQHDWDPEGVLVGNGSNEVIQASLSVAVNTGDPVVAPQPTFALYRLLTGVMGGRYVPVPLDRISPTTWTRSSPRPARAGPGRGAQLAQQSHRLRPAGERCSDVAGRTECAAPLRRGLPGLRRPTALPLLRQSPRVVVLRTFSKAMGMAGLRFGYALAHPRCRPGDRQGQATLQRQCDHPGGGGGGARAQFGVSPPGPRRSPRSGTASSASLAAVTGLHRFPSKANFVLVRCDRVPAAHRVPAPGRGARDSGAGRVERSRAGRVPEDIGGNGGGYGCGGRGPFGNLLGLTGCGWWVAGRWGPTPLPPTPHSPIRTNNCSSTCHASAKSPARLKRQLSPPG